MVYNISRISKLLHLIETYMSNPHKLIHRETFDMSPLCLKFTLGRNKENLDKLKEKYPSVQFNISYKGADIGIKLSCSNSITLSKVCKEINVLISDALVIVNEISAKKKIFKEREKRKKDIRNINKLKTDIDNEIKKKEEEDKLGVVVMSNIPIISEPNKNNMYYGLEIED